MAGRLMFWPDAISDLVGLSLGVPIYLWQRLRKPIPASA